MWKLSLLCFLLLCSSAALVIAQGSRNRPSEWHTLTGNAPLVVARGGLSGLFPDSSSNAYSLAVVTGLPNLHVWCDVQLTKDGRGICFPDIKLQNASDIDFVYPKGRNTYVINGVSTPGWFSVDFTLKDLERVNMRQSIYSRTPSFDGSPNQILTIEDMVTQIQPPGLWLSVPHDAFFSQHNQNMRSYIISVSRNINVSYISSPEVDFLKSVASQFRRTKTGHTKLVFQLLGPDEIEPTTRQTYGSLLTNLAFIKTFATGILVPKCYIFPVDNSLYLQDSKSIVVDAHAAGLEVFASNFANDARIPYNYSFDPVTEYLSFIDNGKSSVDGVISDFAITASATVDCYAHIGKNDTVTANVLVISNEGASGDYPGCTDKAYEKAVSDGVDILDCPVQITKDGIPICLGSINLRERTTVSRSQYINMATDNPDLGIVRGVFTYNLTWTEIQSLQPAASNPYSNYAIYRNPKTKNDGNLMQLSDFLAFASASSVSGVVIGIENAAYLAEKRGLGVTDVVLDTLSKAGFNNQTAKKVMIRSSDSAVLSKFKSNSNYELVYLVDKDVSDISNSTILEIQKFASSVVISTKSVFPTAKAFLISETNVVPKLQAFNLSVYVQFFQNEFVSQAWDFFSDPYVKINTHFTYMGINGVITDFPATAARFKRNRCLGYETVPPYMSPVQPGSLLSIMSKQDLPPAEAANPILTVESVIQPPLPPVKLPTTDSSNSSTEPPNEQPTLVQMFSLSQVKTILDVLIRHVRKLYQMV